MGRISQKQLAANRANARQSTGPRTEAGKIRSRGNAVQHGLTATQVLLPGETAQAFDTFRMDIIASLNPLGATEAFWAERVASLIWRIQRLPAFEAALYHRHDAEAARVEILRAGRIPGSATGPGDIPGGANGASQIKGTVVERLLSSGQLDRLSRYDAGLQRQIRDALRTLADLQAQRQLADRDVADVEVSEIVDGDQEGERSASQSGASVSLGDTLGSA